MFDKDQKNLQSLLIERIIAPDAGHGDRWRRNKQNAEKIAKDSTQKMHLVGEDPHGLGEKLLSLTVENGVAHDEVKNNIHDIALKGFLPQVKQYLQFVKNTMTFKPQVRQAATALLVTYGFEEQEENIGKEPYFKKGTPTSWEEYKKILSHGADMDPKHLKSLSPEERKKTIDKFFKPPR